MNLYKCRTIAQFKIGVWLESRDSGLTIEQMFYIIASDVESIANPEKQYLNGAFAPKLT